MKKLFLSGGVMPFCMDQAGDAGGNQGAGDGGDAPKIYRPEGLPDHLAGENDQATIDNLFKAVEGYRKKQSTKDVVPESADKYIFEVPEELKDKILRAGDDGKDQILEAFKPIAHKHGIGQAAFNEMALEFSKSVFEMQNAAAQDDAALADFDYTEYGGADKAQPVIDGVNVWANGLKATGKLDDADLNEIKLMAAHSQGLRVLSKLREMTGEKAIPVGGEKADGGAKITQDMLNARVADPRYRSDSKDFDPAFHKETTEMYKELYNNS